MSQGESPSPILACPAGGVLTAVNDWLKGEKSHP